MGWEDSALGRVTAIVCVAALVATVLTAVVGAVWRLAFWQTMHGPHGATAMSGGTFTGPGFEWGFGLPLSVVVGWAVLLGVALAAGFVLYQRVAGTAARRVGRLDTVERERP